MLRNIVEDYYQGHIFYIFYVGKILIDDNKIIKAIKNNFGTYAIPSNIIALNELPKTKSGKILRRLLRDLINHNNLNEKDLSTINNINIIKDIKNKIKESHENEKIFNLVSKAIGIDRKKLNINSTNKDFDQWDSLGQLKILFSIQKNFQILKMKIL